jgi:hypothetical protein
MRARTRESFRPRCETPSASPFAFAGLTLGVERDSSHGCSRLLVAYWLNLCDHHVDGVCCLTSSFVALALRSLPHNTIRYPTPRTVCRPLPRPITDNRLRSDHMYTLRAFSLSAGRIVSFGHAWAPRLVLPTATKPLEAGTFPLAPVETPALREPIQR